MAVCCQVAMERWTDIMQMNVLIYFSKNKEFGVGRKCDAYYRCQGGVASAVKCPSGTTFDSVSKSCKPGNHSIGLGCQLYCNPNFKMYGFPNNLAECPYPEQFSEVTHRCENFTKVSCGSRPKIKEYCKFCLYYELLNSKKDNQRGIRTFDH